MKTGRLFLFHFLFDLLLVCVFGAILAVNFTTVDGFQNSRPAYIIVPSLLFVGHQLFCLGYAVKCFFTSSISRGFLFMGYGLGAFVVHVSILCVFLLLIGFFFMGTLLSALGELFGLLF